MIKSFGLDRDYFLQSIERAGSRSRKASEQISSGIRVRTASDDPARVAMLLDRQSERVQTEQVIANLQKTSSEVNFAESTLRDAAKLIDKALVSGTKGASDTLAPDIRSALAGEVRSIEESLTSVANRQMNGRYIFSGDADQIPPYSYDEAVPGGVVRHHNLPDTRLLSDANGVRFAVSRRAQDIFDLRNPDDTPAAKNVFQSLYNLSSALATGTTEDVSNSLTALRGASDYFNEQLAFYGITQNRLSSAEEHARQRRTALDAGIAEIRDTDLPAAILELTESKTTLEAALSTQANVNRRSLFDYLG